MPKIEKLREIGYKGDIEVDCQINTETIKIAAKEVAKVFVAAGSSFLRSEEPNETISVLRNNALN